MTFTSEEASLCTGEIVDGNLTSYSIRYSRKRCEEMSLKEMMDDAFSPFGRWSVPGIIYSHVESSGVPRKVKCE